PTFIAAGGSHAKGIVPDPGATSHSHFPYLLGDDAAFHIPSGRVLGTNYVATDESTASATIADLTTADSVSFTLDASQDVLVVWSANVYQSTAGQNCRDEVVFDGTGDGATITDWGAAAANTGVAAV